MDRKSFLKQIGLSSAGIAASTLRPLPMVQRFSEGNRRPNILLIMADDMGFSDINCYGSEIQTPNIDRLASKGLKFTQFYNAARCCPTRASLITGLYPHQTGIGHMMKDRGAEGYRGDLNRNCMTIAEVLSDSGCSTYMCGKWHLTKQIGYWSGEEELTSKHNWPLQRGFDHFYGTIIGAGSYYNPVSLTRGNSPIRPDSEDYYYTDAISEEMVQFLNEHERFQNDRPFFGYLSYTAPHWPLHALEEDIKKYEDQYLAGWDKIRERRLEKMRELGLIDPDWALSERDPRVPAWENADNKQWEARRMAVYAAQIDRMDQGIGRIIETLEQNDQLENTLIFFIADNGGAAEILTKEWKGLHAIPEKTRDGRPVELGNYPKYMPGPATTYQSYGIGWANVSNSPFRLYKHYVHEGGTASPLIVHWPSVIPNRDEWRHQPSHVIDIMSTCVDVANAQYPSGYGGNSVHPLEGISLVSTFEDNPHLKREVPLYWEHEGNRAIRAGKWKLVQRHNQKRELFNMENDRTETTNLSVEFPEKLHELEGKYQNWAERVGVLPWPVKQNH